MKESKLIYEGVDKICIVKTGILRVELDTRQSRAEIRLMKYRYVRVIQNMLHLAKVRIAYSCTD
jgi:hypothetical protein